MLRCQEKITKRSFDGGSRRTTTATRRQKRTPVLPATSPTPLGPRSPELGGLVAVPRLLHGGVPRSSARGGGHLLRGGHGRGPCGLPRHPPWRVPGHPADRQASGLLKHRDQPRGRRQGGGALVRDRPARSDGAARRSPRAGALRGSQLHLACRLFIQPLR